MIKAICFDWGGVLVKSQPIFPGTADILNMDKDELRQFYLQYNHLAGVGDMSYKDLWTVILDKLGKADKTEQVHAFQARQHSNEYYPEMLKLIDELRNKNYKTGLLSNNTKEAGQRIRAEGMEKYFDTFLVSAEIGLQKPDPRAFQMLFDSLGVLPEEAVFIDDSEPSLSTAEQIGYHPILFTGHEDLKAKLSELNII